MENKEIIKALIKFQKDVPKLELNTEVTVVSKRTGAKYKFKYASLPYIVETIQPTLTACGLAIYYSISELEISIIVAHESGQHIRSCLPLQFGENPQENGSIITYYKRYLLTSVLNLVAEQDDDANISIGNSYEKKEIKEWLTPENFQKALKSDKKGITATLNAYNGASGKGMKKEYKEQLLSKLKELK